jgi:acetyl-CoA C-acetyltransferase
VTGGLPYHGGPGSNYCAHSIATMVERLRAEPGAFGLVSGVGMHMAHHVFALYSTEPGSVAPPDAAAVQKRVDGAPRRALRDTAAGSATVRTYSVVHGREGPRFAAAVCDLPSGERCYARSDDPALLAALESEEWVGRDVELASQDAGVNRIQA